MLIGRNWSLARPSARGMVSSFSAFSLRSLCAVPALPLGEGVAAIGEQMRAAIRRHLHRPAMLAQEELIPGDRERHRVIARRRARCDAANAGCPGVRAFPAKVGVVDEVVSRDFPDVKWEGLRADERRV